MANYNPPNMGTGAGTGGESTRTLGSESTSNPSKVGTSMASEAEKAAEGVTGAIGTRLERAGDYLEEKGKAAFISDRLHSAGRYLQENDVRTITRSVDEAICAHPYRSMLFGLGIGWVVGKFISR